jgi:hypothetical protein
MENKKNYEEVQMGFDRTQLYKEYIQPQINRSSALSNVLSFVKIMGLKPTTEELFLMVERFQSFVETGDKDWVKRMDKFIKEKYEDVETTTY